MRTAVQNKAPRGQQVSRPYPLPVPTKGWIASENIAAMPEDSAYIMENIFPETSTVRIRNGNKTFATLPDTAPVKTVMVHESGGTTTIFAAQNGNIYDVTAGGSISSAAVTGQTADEYITTNFATSGGNYLIAPNGADAMQIFDGTSWSGPSITGVSSDTIFAVFPFKSRLFFLVNDSATVYYIDPDSIAGAASALAIGGELTLGGTIIAGASLLINSATGPDDYCVFISSEGEVVAYQGTNPSSADAWQLVGVFRISRPIGKRCILQIGGDLAVLCADGVMSLLRAIQSDLAADAKAAFSNNIRSAFASQYAQSGTLPGWQIISWPTAHMAIVNIPITSGEISNQYVMNVLTGAWGKYTGINAYCFGLAGTKMYFGSVDGAVVEFEAAGNDDGDDVNAMYLQAYNMLRAPGIMKQINGLRVFSKGDSDFTVGVNMSVDFNNVDVALASDGVTNADLPLWDTAHWDKVLWTSPERIKQSWFGISGIGYYVAPAVFLQTSSTLPTNANVLATSILFEAGAFIG
jgi:hypothetical protein